MLQAKLHNNQFSTPAQTGPEAYPASYTAANGSLYWDKAAEPTANPHIAPKLKKEYSYTSTHPQGLHGLFQGELALYYLEPKNEPCRS